MLIGMTYDLRSEYLAMGYGEEETAEFDREETIASIESALTANGHTVERIGHIHTLATKLLAARKWDLVFNIAEGLAGFSREAQVPALLEAYGVPCTGSDPLTLGLTQHKGYAKIVVRAAGLATPDFAVASSQQAIDRIEMPFPLFVKPVAEGTGKGISGKSKVNDAQELRAICRELLDRFGQPVLIEQYLGGREVTVGVLGTGDDAIAVGTLEITPIQGAEVNAYTYWNKENCEEVIRYSIATDDLARRAEKLAVESFRALGCRDAGRVDIRADENGNVHFLEVNALPGLHPTHSDLPMICERVGITYNELIGRIARSAIKRIGPDNSITTRQAYSLAHRSM